MFKNRQDAALQLSAKLIDYKNNSDTIILAIPRGGVEISHYLAQKLNLPHDIVMTKKIGFPGHEELAIGAVDADGNIELNESLLKSYSIERDSIMRKGRDIKKMWVKLVDIIHKSPTPGIEFPCNIWIGIIITINIPTTRRNFRDCVTTQLNQVPIGI